LVIPSLPGYGFSGKPSAAGWGPERIARTWTELMKRLGYTKYVAQGGDWGALITQLMGAQAAPGLLGIHTNMPGAVPPDIDKAAFAGAPAPSGLSADEQHAYDRLVFFYTRGLAYAQEMGNRPQTLYGIADSPIGLAGWILDHDASSYAMMARVFDGKTEGLTRDDILDNITFYWLTKTGVSSARLYWENKLAFFAPKNVADSSGCSSAQLGGESFSQAHLLQQASERRSLRGLGAAGVLCVRRSCSVQVAAHIDR
jgi:pimeloyl-ACP methyl ester carboxylesterase